MRALILLSILVVVLYVSYHLVPVEHRARVIGFITRHAVQIGFLLLLVVGVAALAYYFPLSSLTL